MQHTRMQHTATIRNLLVHKPFQATLATVSNHPVFLQKPPILVASWGTRLLRPLCTITNLVRSHPTLCKWALEPEWHAAAHSCVSSGILCLMFGVSNCVCTNALLNPPNTWFHTIMTSPLHWFSCSNTTLHITLPCPFLRCSPIMEIDVSAPIMNIPAHM